MGQLVVRNLGNGVKAGLQRRAKRNGRSMEAEVRDILRNSVHENETPAGGLGSEIAVLFSGIGLEEEIPEIRGQRLKPPSFES